MASRVAIPVAVVVAAVVAAVLATSSGSASSHQSPGTPGAIVISSSGSAPAGYTVYRGAGFSFALPSGFEAQPGAAAPGVPPGATAPTFTPEGQAPGTADAEIVAVVNDNFQYTVAQAATSLSEAEAADPSVSELRTAEQTVTVSGAQAARVVNESYVGTDPRTVYQRTWLMVSPHPGLLVDLVIVLEPDRGATVNPNTIVDSFRLDGRR